MTQSRMEGDMALVSKRVSGGIRASIADLEVDDKILASAVMWYLIDWFATRPDLCDKLDPRDWQHLGAYSRGALESDLVNKLHKEHRHPDYEYQSIESGRKQGDGRSPEGYGWETNWLFHDNEFPHLAGQKYEDFDRDDFTDTAWWRRLKTDAAHDEVDPFDHGQPKITLDRITLHDVLKMVAANVNPGYFPTPTLPSYDGFELSNATEKLQTAAYIELVQNTVAEINNMQTARSAVRRPEFNSKPEYIERGDFLNNLRPGANCWHPSWSVSTEEDSVICRYDGKVTHKADPDTTYFYVEVAEADILINLKKPFTESFIRVNLKGVKERGGFRNWTHFAEVAINPYTLRAAIELQA